MPHEWLRVGDRHVRTDALDHHRDHFLPDMTDTAWDVAGATSNGNSMTERVTS
jgi:hypothetical protein